jgi:uncharacterized protein YijF (DUF1287 family)
MMMKFALVWSLTGFAGVMKSSNNAPKPCPVTNSVADKLSTAAIAQTKILVKYDPTYFPIKYPGGDVPEGIGVCTDVIIRTYRTLGYDLQKLIHEDMKKARDQYNKRRKTDKLDTNIDHRRTPNMMTFFERHGKTLAITDKGEDYLPGDIVFWDIKPGHVGIVVNQKVLFTNRYYIVHNICCGNKMEDYLFAAKIVGHYRWHPE